MNAEERYKAALEKIVARRERETRSWHPDQPKAPTEYGRGWRDGYVTAMATVYLDAWAALNPEEAAESDERWKASASDSDREWFERTGHCGRCGNPAEWCVCTDDDPCGCGPHELDPRVKECGWCRGTGKTEPPRQVTATAPTGDDAVPPRRGG